MFDIFICRRRMWAPLFFRPVCIHLHIVWYYGFIFIFGNAVFFLVSHKIECNRLRQIIMNVKRYFKSLTSYIIPVTKRTEMFKKNKKKKKTESTHQQITLLQCCEHQSAEKAVRFSIICNWEIISLAKPSAFYTLKYIQKNGRNKTKKKVAKSREWNERTKHTTVRRARESEIEREKEHLDESGRVQSAFWYSGRNRNDSEKWINNERSKERPVYFPVCSYVKNCTQTKNKTI